MSQNPSLNLSFINQKFTTMKKYLRSICCLCLYLTTTYILFTNTLLAQSVNSGEEIAIRTLVTRFYEGWNVHDAEKMVSVYADSIDHINAFGQWHKGKQAIKADLVRFHATEHGKKSQKIISIEKVKFIKPDVAVALVRQSSTVRNMGMFVLSKVSGKWLVDSFANVEYKP